MEALLFFPLFVFLLLLLLLLVVYKYGTRTHGSLEKLGIPVIKPYPFFGSYLQPWTKHADDEDLRNAKRFGEMWGQYDGMVPNVYIGDMELAKRILIKDFEYFQDRPISLMDFEYTRDLMDLLKGEMWKTVRSLFSKPIASGAKLKAMMPTIRDCTEAAFQRLDVKLQSDSEIVIQNELFGPLVLDVMSQFSFGIKIPNINDQSNPFVMYSQFLRASDEEPPGWKSAMKLLFSSGDEFKALVPSLKFFCEVLTKSIKERRISGGTHNDIVDIMIDAIDNKIPTKEFRDLNITENVILVQGAELLLASYGTTATVLTFCTYHLTQQADIMVRVIEEIEGETEVTYESVQRMPLLDAVVKETMRLSSLVTRHIRECTRDWTHDGVRIPAGTNIIIAATPIHLDPAEFPDPERFLPDRWLSEDGHKLGQYHWMPFGLGPRACIGSRLAILEMKFILARFLMKYRVSACGKTRLQAKRGMSVFKEFFPVWLNVEKR